MVRMKRLGRYLIGQDRVVTTFGRQDTPTRIGAWVGTYYAGCKETRKSTSGGVLMIGSHMLKGWSNTQSVLALSSGEAEYYGMVRGSSTALGAPILMEDMGMRVQVRVLSDSSAALGIARRRGLGTVRHIELNQLWCRKGCTQDTSMLGMSEETKHCGCFDEA